MTDVAEHDLTAEIARLRLELDAWKSRAAAAEAAADHDVLTPALNRRGFIGALQRTMAYCQRHGVPAVLLYLDMDGFKSVNDTLGHAAGVAAHSADRIRFAQVRQKQTGHGDQGGDEFALLMLHAGLDEGRAKARQLAQALQTEGFVWDGQKTELGGSFGVRAWDGHTDAEAWLAEADAAMWVRKKGR